MNSAQLYTEPTKKRPFQPQVLVGACLLAAMLIGASLWNPASEDFGCGSDGAVCTNSQGQ